MHHTKRKPLHFSSPCRMEVVAVYFANSIDKGIFCEYNITVLYGGVISERRTNTVAEKDMTTLERIHVAAKAEFLAKGFKSASLRNIVKTLGMTTGAFYGYYKSKEELFDALVGEQYNTFIGKYKETQEAFTQLSPEKQKESMGVESGECMDWMMAYAYDHLDAFKLILCCSEGTKYENMVHEMVEIEIEATHAFGKILEGLGMPAYKIDPQLEHMLVSGFLTAAFETIIHDMPRDKAMEYIRKLRAFHTAGWKEIMGF